MGDEPPGRRWRSAAALAVLVAATAAVGVLIAVLQRPPSHAPIQATAIPTSTPTAPQASPSLNLSGTWAGLCSGTANGFCTLTLRQTANGLDGTFLLSSPPGKLLDIRGNLIGSTITLRSSGVVRYGRLLKPALDIDNGVDAAGTVIQVDLTVVRVRRHGVELNHCEVGQHHPRIEVDI